MLYFLFSLVAFATAQNLKGCDNGIHCTQTVVNGLTFDCRTAGSPSSGDAVMLLHGFPEWSAMYMPLMRRLADERFYSVACNLRAYSPGARPDGVEAYNYLTLGSDVWALADAFGLKKFHLVGHDHGAVLGWTLAASERGTQRLLSYSGLSVPHVDAFSNGLYGPNADKEQQMASTYFSVFLIKQSAQLYVNALYMSLGYYSGGTYGGPVWTRSSEFQKAIWWYDGAMAAGVIALPPSFSATTLTWNGYYAMAAMRTMYGYGSTPRAGTPQTNPSGNVDVPALYVCGSDDDAILCNRPYALDTAHYCTAGYQYLETKCGHDILACSDDAETEKVIMGIIHHLHKYGASRN